MRCTVCVCYLKQQRALQFAVRTTEQICGHAVTAQPEPSSEPSSWDPTSPARILGLLYGNWKNKFKKKKNNKPKRENPYTSCFQERTQCAYKATKQKREKKQKKRKKKTEKLSICSENQRRLPHWLSPFVILIVLMTPKIPKIPFSVRSAFCSCSSMIWTPLADMVWTATAQTPQRNTDVCEGGC